MGKAQVTSGEQESVEKERAKRIRVERNIYKRTDMGAETYEVRAYVARKANGSPHHEYRYITGTLSDARDALTTLKAEVIAGKYRVPVVEPSGTDVADEEPRLDEWDDLTKVNDAIEGWRLNGWQDLSPSTTRRYISIFQVHVKDTIGKDRVSELTPYKVETYFRGLKDKGLSRSSVRQTRALLHRACSLASKWSERKLQNPIHDAGLPVWTLAEKGVDVRSPTAAELRKLLAAVPEENLRFASYLRLIAATGIRRGEAAAVCWEDLDLTKKKTVRINKSIVADVDGAKVRAPKSKASIRKLSIDAGTASLLRRLRAEAESAAKFGEFEVEPTHFCFASELPGTNPPHPDWFSHTFADLREQTKVASDIHLHSLRHWQSTALDSVLSPTQKQRRMGWSNSAAAQMDSTYTDTVEAEDVRAAEHIGGLLDGPPTKKSKS
jgi:integrase